VGALTGRASCAASRRQTSSNALIGSGPDARSGLYIAQQRRKKRRQWHVLDNVQMDRQQRSSRGDWTKGQKAFQQGDQTWRRVLLPPVPASGRTVLALSTSVCSHARSTLPGTSSSREPCGGLARRRSGRASVQLLRLRPVGAGLNTTTYSRRGPTRAVAAEERNEPARNAQYDEAR